MRVLHFDGGNEWRGGQKQVFLLHRGLLGAGVDSHVVCASDGPLLDAIQRELGEVTGRPFQPSDQGLARNPGIERAPERQRLLAQPGRSRECVGVLERNHAMLHPRTRDARGPGVPPA